MEFRKASDDELPSARDEAALYVEEVEACRDERECYLCFAASCTHRAIMILSYEAHT
jgi:hypothetical protein